MSKLDLSKYVFGDRDNGGIDRDKSLSSGLFSGYIDKIKDLYSRGVSEISIYMVKNDVPFQSVLDNLERYIKDIEHSNIGGVDYRKYIAEIVLKSIIFGVFCGVLGVFFGYRLPPIFSLSTSIDFVYTLGRYIPDFVYTFLKALVGGVLFGVVGMVVFFVFYSLYLKDKAEESRELLEDEIPRGLVYMYSRSLADPSILGMVREVSSLDEIYPVLSQRFRRIVGREKYSNMNIKDAIRKEIVVSENEKYADFLEKLRRLSQTGGGVKETLYREIENLHRESKRDMEKYLDKLEMISQIYLVFLLVGGLFLTVLAIIMNITVQSGYPIGFIIYFLLPFINIVFLGFLEYNFRGEDRWDESSGRSFREELDSINVEGWRKYLVYIKNIDLYSYFKFSPYRVLFLSVPIGFLYLYIMYSYVSFHNPISSYMFLWFFTSVVCFGPLSFFSYMNYRHHRLINRGLPDKLIEFRNAKASGKTLQDCLLVCGEDDSKLSDVFLRMGQAIKVKGVRSVKMIARETKNRRLVESIDIIVQAQTAHSRIEEAVDILEKDIRRRVERDRKRIQETFMQQILIFFAFIIFLFVVLMVGGPLLDRIANIDMGSSASASSGFGDTSLSFGKSVNVEKYKRYLHHLIFIQSGFGGLFMGKLREGTYRSGIKYSLTMLFIGIIVISFLE